MNYMNRISAFISYSVRQKVIGGKFRSHFTTYCGYNTFIAHDDIPVSSIWEDEIIKAIETADFFIPLISNNFKSSDFTDQETGIAINLKKKIIPIKLEELNPYGFISKYQALQYKTYQTNHSSRDNVKELVLTISNLALHSEGYQPTAIHSLLYAFRRCTSPGIANAIIENLCTCTTLTNNHLTEIVEILRHNKAIAKASKLVKAKEFLKKTYKLCNMSGFTKGLIQNQSKNLRTDII